jgi:hypothetical protein
MSDYRQMVVNEDGEPLGIEIIYADEGFGDDYDDYGPDDYDEGDFEEEDAKADSENPETDLDREWDS